MLLEDLQFYFQNFLLFYAPLGIIGIWRWSVWLWQKLFALKYRPYQSDPKAREFSYSVITPVYNEDPEVFYSALTSWQANNPTEIIAVIDKSDKTSIEIFKTFQLTCSQAKLIVTEIPGKRPALAQGIEYSSGEITVLADSDTIWEKDISTHFLSPFLNSKIGGVATRQKVLQPKTFAEKLFSMRLDLRYLHEYPYLMVMGNALTCLSGRTAVYRRSAIFPLLDDLVNEKFLGKPVISGDDKRLTSLLQRNGWKTQYQKDAVVWTPGMKRMRDFFSQNLRWNRNSWRTDIQTIFSLWPWKREKFFAYHLIDRSIQPFTLLLGPIYLGVSLVFNQWLIAIILVSWWMISRTIKLYPHLRNYPAHIFYIPLYAFSQYLLAVQKIYALFTLDYQSWITRWDKKRMLHLNFFQLFPSRAATFSIIFGMSFFIFQHQVSVAENSVKSMIEYTEDFSAFNIADQKQDFWDKREKAKTVSYLTRKHDTPLLIAHKFNISPENISKIFPGISPHTPLYPNQKIYLPVDYMSEPEKPGDTKSIQSPYITYNSYTNTIRVKGRGAVVTLPFIEKVLSVYDAAGEPPHLEEIAPGEWIMRSNLYISDGAKLVIDGKDVEWLKMNSDENEFVFLRSYNGSIIAKDTKITSWNEKTQTPDLKYDDGRSYVLAKANGRMDIINSEIAYLGFPLHTELKNDKVGNSRVGGIYGLSWKINSGDYGNHLLAGSLINSSVHDNYYGVYSFGATGLRITNNSVYNNVEYGIDPHDDSNNLLIENNIVYGNGNHGIIGSKRVTYSTIRNNVTFNNKLHGIMLDRQSNYNLVEYNSSYDNVNGIAIYDSHANFVHSNTFKRNQYGIRANVNSSNNIFQANIIADGERGIFLYKNAKDNIVLSNIIKNNKLGIYLKNSTGNKIANKFSRRDNKWNIKTNDVSPSANHIMQMDKSSSSK